MNDSNNFHFVGLENEVRKICQDFLDAKGLSYFHFSRTFKNGASLILTSNEEFMKSFLHNNLKEISYLVPVSIHQSLVYFCDECLTENLLMLTRKRGFHHGLRILNRYKEYYDSTVFAMANPHPSPFSYYLSILPDLRMFSEMFPKRADSLIKKIESDPLYLSGRQDKNGQVFFLPERSQRIFIGKNLKRYVTTYELLCMKLFQAGKSYKEIGSILSISSRSVETYLARLKTRTGLSANNLLTQSFTVEPLDTYRASR